MTPDEIFLRTVAHKNGLAITDIALSKLTEYVEQLRRWNKSINLVSRKDEENIWLNHILLSLAFLFKIDIPPGTRVLDLGTGGGLPGIPLSILRTDIDFVLVDSIRKKTVAVQEMVTALSLPNVSVICGRAEEIGMLSPFKERFNAVIARAVAPLDSLVAWARPFLVHGNQTEALKISKYGRISLDFPCLITIKGGSIQSEIEKARRRFPQAIFHEVDAIFNGSEVLENSERKIVLVENNQR